MGWNGSLSADSPVNSSIVYTPDNITPMSGGFDQTSYSVSAFTAPKKGVYLFRLLGSGGHNGIATGSPETPTSRFGAGGIGGLTEYHMVLEKGQTVYVGCGGQCAAAFLSKTNGSSLSTISTANYYAIAGGGGGGGAVWNGVFKGGAGGNGGGPVGAPGAAGSNASGGNPGTSSSGYARLAGAPTVLTTQAEVSTRSGHGGDGWWGGETGQSLGGSSDTDSTAGAGGGGGGSGYVKEASVSFRNTTYNNVTRLGGGAGANANGSVAVTLIAIATDLPLFFNGQVVQKVVYNGTEVQHLVYNGIQIF